MPAHEIDRLIFKVDGKVGAASRDRIRSVVLRVLEELFDRYFPGNEIVEISRIELDLGTVRPDRLTEDLTDRIRALLEAEFAKILLPGNVLTADDAASGPTGRQMAERMTEYMRHGISREPTQSLAVMFSWMLENQPVQLDRLMLDFARSHSLRNRLYLQVPGELLERYWKSADRGRWMEASRWNTAVLEALGQEGIDEQELRQVREYLRRRLFEFLMGPIRGSAGQRDGYELQLRLELRRKSAKEPVAAKVLRKWLREDRPSEDKGRKAWLAFVQFVSGGGFSEQARDAASALRTDQFDDLVRLAESDPEVAFRRVFEILDPTQLVTFLSVLRRQPSYAEKVRSLAFADGLVRRTFAVELLDQPRHLIPDFLSGPAGPESLRGFITRLLEWLQVYLDREPDRIISDLRSFLSRVRHLHAKDWTIVADAWTLPDQAPSTDDVSTMLDFFRIGRWQASGSASQMWYSLFRKRKSELGAAWKKAEADPEAWRRLVSLDIDSRDLQTFLAGLYPADSSVSAVWSVASGKSSSEAKAIWYRYANLKAMASDLPDRSIRRLFSQEEEVRQRRRRPESEIIRLSETADEETVDGDVYVKAFLHWLTFGTFILPDLERDGTVVAWTRIQSAWSGALMEQIRRDPEPRDLIRRFFRLLAVEDHRTWFRLLAPRLERYWEEWTRIAGALDMDPAELLSQGVELELLGLSAVSDDRRYDALFHQLDSVRTGDFRMSREDFLAVLRGDQPIASVQTEVLRRLEDSLATQVILQTDLIGIAPEEWLRLGVSPEGYPRHTWVDLLSEVARNGSLPGWSVVYSAAGLERLLYAASPEIVHRLLREILRGPGNAARFVSAVGLSAYVKWLAVADHAFHGWLKSTSAGLAEAHRWLGDRQAVVQYFTFHLLVRAYDMVDRQRTVMHVLAAVPLDFAFSSAEHEERLGDVRSPLEEIRTYLQIRQESPSDADLADAPQSQLDLLMSVLNGNPRPWWSVQEPDLGKVVLLAIRNDAAGLMRMLRSASRYREWLISVIRWGGDEAFETWIGSRFSDRAEWVRRMMDQIGKWQPGVERAWVQATLLHVLHESRSESQVALSRRLIAQMSVAYGMKTEAIDREWKSGPSAIVELEAAAEPDPREWIREYVSAQIVPVRLDGRPFSQDELINGITRFSDEHPDDFRSLVVELMWIPSVRSGFVRRASDRVVTLIISILAGDRHEPIERYRVLMRQWVGGTFGNDTARSWDEAYAETILLRLTNTSSGSWSPVQLVASVWIQFRLALSAGATENELWMGSGLPPELIAGLTADLPDRLPDATDATSPESDHLTVSMEVKRVYGDRWPEWVRLYHLVEGIFDSPGLRVPRVLLGSIFIRQVNDPANASKSVRMLMAGFLADVIRRFGFDLQPLLDRLRMGGYPVSWIESVPADAGLKIAEKQATPVEAVAVKVAYFDASYTLLHYLKIGSWPIHAEKTGYDLTTFLENLTTQTGVDVSRIRSDVRTGLADRSLLERVATGEGDDGMRSLIRFLFPETAAQLFMLREWLVPRLTARGAGGAEIQQALFHRILLESAIDPVSRYWSPDATREKVVMEMIRRQQKKPVRFTGEELMAAGLSARSVDRLAAGGWIVPFDGYAREGSLTELLIQLWTAGKVPWWASDIPIDLPDVEFSKTRLVDLVLRTEPEELIARLDRFQDGMRLQRRILSVVDDDQFYRWVGGFRDDRMSAWIIWLDMRLAVLETSADRVSWRMFMLDQLSARPSDQDFTDRILTHLSVLTGRSSGDWAWALLAGSPPVRIGTETDSLRRLLASRATAPVSEPTDSWAETFDAVVRHYLIHGSVKPGQLPGVNTYERFHQLLREQIALGSERLLSVMRETIRVPAVRRRLEREAPMNLMALLVQVIFPVQYRSLGVQRGAWFRFFRDQIPGISAERFDRIWLGALVDAFGEKGVAGDGLEKIIVVMLRRLRTAFSFTREIGASVLSRYGVPDAVVQELVRSDVGVIRTPEAPLDAVSDNAITEPLVVSNAGLVIVWPFLPRYFDMLGMMDKSAFINDETATRAVLLLQFMVTGTAAAPEHELVLNKVLCGLPLSTPVPLSIELTEREREVTSQLLNGVLQNWPKLKNSSIDALREGFLVRDGYLRETEQTWDLKVEKRTLDILMQSMPWSLGTIKYSWMKKRLLVEWR